VADNAAADDTPPPALTLLAAAPAAPTPEPISAPPPPPITRPVWLARPAAAEIAIFYPERALVRELPGRAILDCVVQPDGSLGCLVQSETPAGYGFGEAALGIAQSFRMARNLDDGSATEGRHVSVPIAFAQN
jgi:protein TonB